ncbi:hypothetical protein MATL_G00193730 [Megalops atlanticus]|uniref:FH2 domain-containing protein n=1 Tax=Megalops atlanticus TaxID=7932 RepID=A0A9D3SZ42_MEGAT|nr:hypothetical protein MATL_G00193730 [Megalops atlanticus]
MHVMNSLSLANEKQNCNGEGRVADPTPTPPLRKKKRVRSFFWKTIPEEKVRAKPNIWTLASRQQQYQIDARTIEELFGQQEEARSAAAGAPNQPGGPRGSLKETKEEICILDAKRGMNVGILLKQFKKPNQAIIDDIRLGNSTPFGSEPLKELLKMLPESDEVKKLRAFHGDASRLSLADSFMYLLIQVPSFDVRIEAMVLKEEFFPLCSALSHEIDVVRAATKELMGCEELHAILHLVLQAGNIMNAGGYAGNAVGFKLSSLLSLADTKANKPGMNLLHFVALEAQKKDESLLKFPEKLPHVQRAARVSVENIEAEFQSLYGRTRSLGEKIQKDADLQQQLDHFLQDWARALQDLKKRRLDLRQEGNALIDFFCEDKDTFKLDDCFRIFQDFCLKFKKAVQDNLEREMKEAARQRRLRELEEKRHSWAGSGEQGGVFGRSSSENDVETLTREGLLDFLQQRPGSPHSPLGRSSSARRHRQAGAATAAERELQSYLERTAAADSSRSGSLPRPGRPAHRGPAGGRGDPAPRGLPVTVTPPAEPRPVFRVGPDTNAEPHLDNNHLAPPAGGAPEGGTGHNRSSFQRTAGTTCGQMSVSVERHTLVPRLQPFDFITSNNDNNNNMRLANQGDLIVTDLEAEREPKPPVLDTPPSSASSEPRRGSVTGLESNTDSSCYPEKQERNTVSSVTCDLPLPLDNSTPNRQAVSHLLDSTDTDCSVILDYSETDSPVSRGAGSIAADSRTQGNNVRTLTASENQSMRKVVPISRLNRSTSAASRAERAAGQEGTQRSPRDQSTPARRAEPPHRAPRRPSLPAEDPKAQRASRTAPDQTARQPSFRKPAAKPVRTVPKPPPEEKMCRSTMRALALAQAASAGGGGVPQTATHGAKASPAVPSFARNTVASSSRRMRNDPGPSSTPPTPSRNSPLNRAGSLRHAPNRVAPASGQHAPGGGEKTQALLGRGQSVRSSTRSAHPSETPPSTRDHTRKNSSSLSDKSVHSKDSSSSRTLRPTWK